ncbi:hypothetical protein HOLleu_19795 [Holothuria leucospilota]|uniref:Uncharacterized protein n=1 Tax=Holothuria leucospilota TaxID=206669 RepID=A0A9Q1H866_HOLLE|nr:hypothetical protein HOLleu_19795 [Holothuria leucospilota]
MGMGALTNMSLAGYGELAARTTRTSFLAHARLETARLATRKFGHCNEKSRTAAGACTAPQPALKRPRLIAEISGSSAAGQFQSFPYRDISRVPVRKRGCVWVKVGVCVNFCFANIF